MDDALTLVFDPLNEWWFFETGQSTWRQRRSPGSVEHKLDIREEEGNAYLTWSVLMPEGGSQKDAKRLLVREARLWFTNMAGVESALDRDVGDKINDGGQEAK